MNMFISSMASLKGTCKIPFSWNLINEEQISCSGYQEQVPEANVYLQWDLRDRLTSHFAWCPCHLCPFGLWRWVVEPWDSFVGHWSHVLLVFSLYIHRFLTLVIIFHAWVLLVVCYFEEFKYILCKKWWMVSFRILWILHLTIFGFWSSIWL